MIEMRPAASSKKWVRETSGMMPSGNPFARPRSSEGRMMAVPASDRRRSSGNISHNHDVARASPRVVAPFLAGATLQVRDNGQGFSVVRPPPLRAKGLPSAAKVIKGLARRNANENKVAPDTVGSKVIHGMGAGVSRSKARGTIDERKEDTARKFDVSDAGCAIRKEEFTAAIIRRDDILQVTLLSDSGGSPTPMIRRLQPFLDVCSLLRLDASQTNSASSWSTSCILHFYCRSAEDIPVHLAIRAI